MYRMPNTMANQTLVHGAEIQSQSTIYFAVHLKEPQWFIKKPFLSYLGNFRKQIHPNPFCKLFLEGIQGHYPNANKNRRDQDANSHAVVREQQKGIDWTKFLQGYISKKLKQWHTHLNSGNKQQNGADAWAKKVILHTWEYSQKKWKGQNDQVHGKTSTASESKALKTIKNRVKELYMLMEKDPHMLLSTQ
jgi:hypothetical protein